MPPLDQPAAPMADKDHMSETVQQPQEAAPLHLSPAEVGAAARDAFKYFQTKAGTSAETNLPAVGLDTPAPLSATPDNMPQTPGSNLPPTERVEQKHDNEREHVRLPHSHDGDSMGVDRGENGSGYRRDEHAYQAGGYESYPNYLPSSERERNPYPKGDYRNPQNVVPPHDKRWPF
jgi:hypothetical protein